MDDVGFEPDDHPFLNVIRFTKYLFVLFVRSSNHPGAKYLVRHSIPSPTQQRRPLLPSYLILILCFAWFGEVAGKIDDLYCIVCSM